MTNLPQISLYKFKFTLQALEDMHLPEYKGSMFRGAFGWAFRKAVCVTHKPTCDNCIIKENCSYFNVFETEMPKNNIYFLNGVKKVPHPFIIEPPLEEKREYKKGELIEVGLTLFGNAINFFPFYVFTFQQMGKAGIGYKRGKFKLLKITNYNLEDEGNTIFTNESSKLKTNYKKITDKDILADKDFDLSELTLNFIAPFRIQTDGKIIKNKDDINCQVILLALERRVISISHLFCNNNLNEFTEIDFSGITLLENKLKYKYIERYSNRQKTKMEMGGLVGNIKIGGNLKNILPFIFVCKELNIGKNTAFGLGKFVIGS